MDSPKHFRVWVNLSWFKASKSCMAEWSRRCLGKMARLTQVPLTLGHWVPLPPQPGRSGSIRMLSTWTSTARWSEDSASRKAIRLSWLLPALLPSHSHFHSPWGARTQLQNEFTPRASRCWAHHLHLSTALLPVTHRITAADVTTHISTRHRHSFFPWPWHWCLLGLFICAPALPFSTRKRATGQALSECLCFPGGAAGEKST